MPVQDLLMEQSQQLEMTLVESICIDILVLNQSPPVANPLVIQHTSLLSSFHQYFKMVDKNNRGYCQPVVLIFVCFSGSINSNWMVQRQIMKNTQKKMISFFNERKKKMRVIKPQLSNLFQVLYRTANQRTTKHLKMQERHLRRILSSSALMASEVLIPVAI